MVAPLSRPRKWLEKEQILRKCIRARQDSRIGAITASHARRHDPLQTATVWSETFYACCLLTLHLQRKGFLRSVRRFGNVFPPYSVIYLKHSSRKRRREADRDVTCAHVQLMHIFRIFGQTCAEYRLQETCSINYQVQHAPLLAARLRHHHEIDHQWQQMISWKGFRSGETNLKITFPCRDTRAIQDGWRLGFRAL